MYETLYARDENARAGARPRRRRHGLSRRPDLRVPDPQGREVPQRQGADAADVAASLERYRKVGASASLVAAIDTVAATGPNEVTVKLKQVQSTFLSNMSCPARPIAIMPAEEAAKESGKHRPIGTGPFKFVEYKPDSHVKLARFDDYKPNPAYKGRDGFAGKKVAYLDSVTFRFMPEAGARNAALESGQIHLNETSDGPTAKRLKATPASR